MEDWYKKWRIKIREAQTEKEINKVIQEIFDDGYESAKEECSCGEKEHDDIRYDLD